MTVSSQDLLAGIDLRWLQDSAGRILAGNRAIRQDSSGKELQYHAPSLASDPAFPFRAKYPHQWFWDSCAHAIALSHLDMDMAHQEIESLLAVQDEQGFIPHLIFNPSRMQLIDCIIGRFLFSPGGSLYLQPPVLAQAVQSVYSREGEKEFVRNILPGVKAFHNYLESNRVRSEDGLAEIVHSYESGKDRSREYDKVYKASAGTTFGIIDPVIRLLMKQQAMKWDWDRIFASNLFRVKDLLFNCIYANDLAVLAGLCREVEEMEDSEFFYSRAKRVEKSILNKMYDRQTGLFYSLDSRWESDLPIRVSTVSTFLPLILDTIDKEQVERLVDDYLTNPAEYWLKYPVPAEPLSSPEAKRRRTPIWRGLQTWIYPNWFIVKGLTKQAYRFPQWQDKYLGLAALITSRTYEMVRHSGFREYYHSWTGRGMRARRFGWSTLVLDMVHQMKEAVG